ncbi:MAG: lipocalin family protein [Tannerellaceae bacterium]|jgi:heat shock protein HslJ|nr:lipocalin family protein [Tannerellaceae bacterium]
MKQKKHLLILAIALFLPLFSCTTESEADHLTSGVWKLSYVEALGVQQTTTEIDMEFSISFKTDGTWSGAITMENTLTTENGTYTRSGSTLTIKGSEETMVWSIKTLTKSELIVDFNSEGVTTVWAFKH